jgi:hypothetical protein
MLAHRTFTSSGVHYRKGKLVSIHACSLLHFHLVGDLNDAPFNSKRSGTKSPSRGREKKGVGRNRKEGKEGVEENIRPSVQ